MKNQFKVIMLPTNEATQIYKARTWGLGYYNTPKTYTQEGMGQHLYIVDTEAEYTFEDYVIIDNKLEQVIGISPVGLQTNTGWYYRGEHSIVKVIASTDAALGLPSIHQEFIDDYVKDSTVIVDDVTYMPNNSIELTWAFVTSTLISDDKLLLFQLEQELENKLAEFYENNGKLTNQIAELKAKLNKDTI